MDEETIKSPTPQRISFVQQLWPNSPASETNKGHKNASSVSTEAIGKPIGHPDHKLSISISSTESQDGFNLQDILVNYSDQNGKIFIKDFLIIIDQIDSEKARRMTSSRPILTASGRREAELFMSDHPNMKMSFRDILNFIEGETDMQEDVEKDLIRRNSPNSNIQRPLTVPLSATGSDASSVDFLEAFSDSQQEARSPIAALYDAKALRRSALMTKRSPISAIEGNENNSNADLPAYIRSGEQPSSPARDDSPQANHSHHSGITGDDEGVLQGDGLSQSSYTYNDNIASSASSVDFDNNSEPLYNSDQSSRGKETRLESQLEDVERDLMESHAHNQELLEDLADKKKEVKKIQSLADDQAQIVSQLEREVREAFDLASEWKAKNANLEQSLAASQKLISEKQESIDQLETRLDHANQQVIHKSFETPEGSGNQREELIIQYEKELEDLRSQIESYSELKQQLEVTQKSRNEALEDLLQLRASLTENAGRLSDYSTQVEKREKELESVKIELDTARRQIEAFKAKQNGQPILSKAGLDALKALKRSKKYCNGEVEMDSKQLVASYEVLSKETQDILQVLDDFLSLKTDAARKRNAIFRMKLQHETGMGLSIPLLFTIFIAFTTILLVLALERWLAYLAPPERVLIAF